ncbi:hypothetical protein Sros01_06970 [Streptomyces roseochromogenus]|nr:hypothetical protein Sros01_06970 [Streptomyces roseochromogenus]
MSQVRGVRNEADPGGVTERELRAGGALVARGVAGLRADAVTHGRVPGRDFRLERSVVDGGRVRVEVHDSQGDEPPGEPRYGPAIVDALSDRWGSSPGPVPRESVWAELGS